MILKNITMEEVCSTGQVLSCKYKTFLDFLILQLSINELSWITALMNHYQEEVMQPMVQIHLSLYMMVKRIAIGILPKDSLSMVLTLWKCKGECLVQKWSRTLVGLSFYCH